MANFQWVTPVDFASKQVIGKTELNQIMENMRYLFKTPRSQVTQQSGTYSTTNTSFEAVDTSFFRLELNLNVTCDVLVWCQVITRQTSNIYGENMLDVLQDGTTYLSSLTGTPLTDGIARMGSRYSNGSYKTYGGLWLWEDIAAGDHYWDLMWKDDGSGGQSEMIAGSTFGIMQK